MLKILHLYPNLMNLYGDYANLLLLKKHLIDQGQEVEIIKKELYEKIDFTDIDMVYMGSGSESKQLLALEDLKKHKQNFVNYINNGGLVLFTGNAMELLGEKIDNNFALGLVNIVTSTKDKRFTGDVIVQCKEFGKVVGFINKSTIIEKGETVCLFHYLFKDNNLPDKDYEGYHFNNVYGTHIIGPVLVKNPMMLECFIRKLLKEKPYKAIEYPHISESYQNTLEELSKRKK